MGQMNDTSASPKGTFSIDFFPAFGTGSLGGNGLEPGIWWGFGPATPGNTRFTMRLEDAAPNSTAWLVVGSSNTQWGPNPLPLGMELIGAPNAMLYVSPDFLFGAATDANGNANRGGATNANGNATLSLPIPANAPYTDYWVQWLVKDPAAPNSGGWTFSKAGKVTLY